MKANQYNHQTLLAGQNWSPKITTGIHWLFVHPHKSSFTNHFDVWEILDGRLPPQNHYCFVIEYDPILDYDEVHIQMKTIKRNMQPCWWRWWNFPSMAMRDQSISYTLAKALSHFNTFFVNFATANFAFDIPHSVNLLSKKFSQLLEHDTSVAYRCSLAKLH